MNVITFTKIHNYYQSLCLISAVLTQIEGCIMVEVEVEVGETAAEQREISRKKYGDSPTRDNEQGHAAGDSPEDHKYYEIK